MVANLVSIQAQVTQTYTPAAWVNDPFNANANWGIIAANTTHPTYTNNGVAANANLIGNSPIGGTITLANPGDTAILTGQIILAGNVSSNDKQFRFGLLYKGANTTDTSWGGYFVANTSSSGSGIYLRQLPSNTGFYTSGTGANTPAVANFVFGGVFSAATYDYSLSVTRLSSTSTLMQWNFSGESPSNYHHSGRYTNITATAQGGFSFDQVGFLSGGSFWTAASTNDNITFTNILVSFGAFGDGTWTNNASGLWSATGNWFNAVPANGAGFIGDFSQVSLSADRTVTLDTSRSLGSLIFGATSGSLNNWIINSSGGSVLTLDTGASTRPTIAVNQNTTTINAPLVSAFGLTKTGSGILALRNTNTIVGALNLNSGVVNFLNYSNLFLDPSGIPVINFAGGTLQWATGNTLDISATGIGINFNGNAGFDTGPNNVTLASGFGNGGTGGLIKAGAGTLTLQGSASYSGTTTISNGVLALSGSGSLAGTTNINIKSAGTLNVSGVGGLTLASAETIGGSGMVSGNLTDNSSSIILPGGTATAGTLTVNGNLTLGGNGVGALNFDLAHSVTVGGGVNDLIAVTGTLNIAGTTTMNLNYLTGSPAVGTYTLIQYGSFSGSVGNITAPSGVIVSNNTVAKTIVLIVTHNPANLTWTGDSSVNAWDNGGTTNWKQSGTNQYFFTGDSVTFDNTGSASPSINLVSDMFPGSVTVSASQGYDFTGGGIGSGSLTKSGGGTLILENNNYYPGSTVINGGVLQVGNFGTTGTLGTGLLTNNSALVFALGGDYVLTNDIPGTGAITNNGSAGTVTLAGNISGVGVTMAGSGVMILSGSNSYTGGTLISSGSLQPAASSALGNPSAGCVVQSGGQLYISNNININGYALSLAATGPDGSGALRKGGGGATTFGGLISLTADTQIGVDANSTLNLTNGAGINAPAINVDLAGSGAGNISGPLNLTSGALTKDGSGTWTVAPTNTYTGLTTINSGVLAISGTNALGPVSTFTPNYVTLNGGSLGVTTNVTFADGLRGFTASGTIGGFSIDAGLTLVISNEITGSGTLTKTGPGTLVLAGSNSFTGTLNIDSGINVGNDGSVRIANSNALALVQSPISIRNNNGGVSTLELDGGNGSIIVAQNIALNGRSSSVPAIVNDAGTNTFAGTVRITGSGSGSQRRIESDGGLLILSGIVSNDIVEAVTITFQGNADISVPGVIQDGRSLISVAKQGNGKLILNGTNTYTGITTVSAGILGGSGVISGSVSISSGGTLSPGLSIGTLTINSNLTLAGNTFIKVNKTTGARDQLAGLTSVTYGGTLTISNVSGTFAMNDSFQIFPATTFAGNFTGISPAPGAGLAWNFNPTNGVLSVIANGPSGPALLTNSVSGSTLSLSWPAGQNWKLQFQTNSLSTGLGTNWVDVPGSTSISSTNITINPATPTEYFRLHYP